MHHIYKMLVGLTTTELEETIRKNLLLSMVLFLIGLSVREARDIFQKSTTGGGNAVTLFLDMVFQD